MIECNKISEIYPGHYQVILDFPYIVDLERIIDIDYKFIWIYNHIENSDSWLPFTNGVFGIFNNSEIPLARNINMELLFKTIDFLKILPEINKSLKLVQTNILPPYYLNLNKMNGRAKYKLLKEKADYLFDIDIPGAADFTPLISPNKEFLEKVIKKFSN